MSNPFSQPGTGGDKFDLKNRGNEWLGALMLVWPIAVKADFESGQYDKTDVVEADIALIDRIDPNTGAPLFFKNAFIFSKGLVANTRQDVGGMVLGRLVKKQFQNGVGWSLDQFSDQDAQTAQEYLLRFPRNAPSQPAQQAPAQQQAPQYDMWQNTNAAPVPQQQQAPAAWQQVGAPAPAPAPAQQAAPPVQQQWQAPAPAAAPAPAVDPALAEFLKSKGVTVTPDMTQATAEMIARSFPAA